uniref:Uncharacterized protein n=1 Tax=uncultured Choricystis TaxID=858337 RepID=A0A346HG53_9CHLO|nr:hypothetical protein [uncultured Choricystis]
MLEKPVSLRKDSFVHVSRFLVGNNLNPIGNELDRKVQLALLLSRTTLFQQQRRPPRKLRQYYLRVLFRYYPYEDRCINVVADEHRGGISQLKHQEYRPPCGETRYHLGYKDQIHPHPKLA